MLQAAHAFIHQTSPTPREFIGGGSPYLVDIVRTKFFVKRKMGAACLIVLPLWGLLVNQQWLHWVCSCIPSCLQFISSSVCLYQMEMYLHWVSVHCLMEVNSSLLCMTVQERRSTMWLHSSSPTQMPQCCTIRCNQLFKKVHPTWHHKGRLLSRNNAPIKTLSKRVAGPISSKQFSGVLDVVP